MYKRQLLGVKLAKPITNPESCRANFTNEGGVGSVSYTHLDVYKRQQVAVENSAIVYDDGEGTVSTIVC